MSVAGAFLPAAFAAAASLVLSAPQGPSGPPALLHQVQLSAAERATELQRLHEELNSENVFLRRAAFEIAMQGDDDLVQRLAIDAAMGSTDPDLQTDALRAWLGRNAQLSLDIVLPDRPTEAQRNFFSENEPAWFTVGNVSPTFLRLNWRGNGNWSYEGGFVPGGLRVNRAQCRLDLRVVDRRQLAGALSCGADRSLLVTAALH